MKLLNITTCIIKHILLIMIKLNSIHIDLLPFWLVTTVARWSGVIIIFFIYRSSGWGRVGISIIGLGYKQG